MDLSNFAGNTRASEAWIRKCPRFFVEQWQMLLNNNCREAENCIEE
jgi:hypothetical protein